ncbi:MAG: ABC transporter permease [Cellulosilyticaceae bacterium]
MFTLLRIQAKNLLRDKMIWVSLLLPLIVAIGLRVYVPEFYVEQTIVVLEGQLTTEEEDYLEKSAKLEVYSTEKRLQDAINDSHSEKIGIIRNAQGDLEGYIQGNESTMTKIYGERILKVLSSEKQEIHTDMILQKDQTVYKLLVSLNILMALFIGCCFSAFNIVAEKEDGIVYVNQVLPMDSKQFIIQKLLLGWIGTVILTGITAGIMLSSLKLLLPMIFLTLVGSMFSALLGLLLGHFSRNLMEIIVNTKLILLFFLFIPIIGYFVPTQYAGIKMVFYVVPSYVVFESASMMLNMPMDVWQFIINILILLIETLLGFWCYLRWCKNTRLE